MKSKFQAHREKWIDCTLCQLCERRKRVVILRGSVPAEVLFIGEAPGESEDVLGKPFAGPAGHLLDKIVAEAKRLAGVEATTAFTNLVCCIPRDETNTKLAQPPIESIEACSERLIETVLLVNPKMFVWVGGLAGKHAPKYLPPGLVGPTRYIEIIHPAAILRANISQQGLMIQRSIVTLSEALEEL